MTFGYTLLYVPDVERTVAFYEAAFGLTRGFVHESNQYGELATGGTKLGFVAIGLARSHRLSFTDGLTDGKSPPMEVGLVTDDVPAAFDKAVAAGAAPLAGPATKPWGQVAAYVRDPNGFLVELCTPMG